MRNVTVSLDDEIARWARVEAAKRDTSLSRFVGQVLREHMSGSEDYDQARQSYLARDPAPLGAPDRPYPGRDEIHRR